MPPPSVVCELHLTTVLGFTTDLAQPSVAITLMSREDQGARLDLDLLGLTRMILRQALLLLATLMSQIHTIRTSALTTAISANQRLCFFADVDKQGEKIGVNIRSYASPTSADKFFAIVLLCCELSTRSNETNGHSVVYLQVQSGGSFDIDFEVKDPRDVVILDGTRERQGDYVLTANHVGEYSFCFINDMSTLTEKLVDFDIMVCLFILV
jgi:emp24/gp25L/p24 family/GOLD